MNDALTAAWALAHSPIVWLIVGACLYLMIWPECIEGDDR